jgi:class 3 adenylate cyclase/tetratricopeptide (TPR) repeat protein
MAACAVCGADNRDGARFCDSCGASIAVLGRRQRKLVTVVVCDVVGSTSLGEESDPEAVEVLLSRYFERMKWIVEAHGGTVEKFIGDAVVAVFGVPVAHEDDALRAVRAAVEMLASLPELQVEARLGVNSGEIVTSGYGTIVTGDAINVAARLQQTASAGEILIGEQTAHLAGPAINVGELAALEVKGKTEPVHAFRLVGLRRQTGGAVGSRFVGRERELTCLSDSWDRVQEHGHRELLTVVGEAGVGKSRLLTELETTLGLRAVYGRCLPYGEGITYRPIVDVVRKLGRAPADPAASTVIRSLLLETDQLASAGEIAWAFRKLLEDSAPQLIVFDDVQWGEETFFDLVEHVTMSSTPAPLLVVCLARTEFVTRRPSWPVALELDPLSEPDVEALVPESLSAELRARIVRSSGGNPLFVTEMIAMAAAAGPDVAVPQTLRALLAARLDGLEEDERTVLERGAVEGEIFHLGAVESLVPSELDASLHLTGLMSKELIRAAQPEVPGEEAFSFRHLLLRDAAYRAIPQAVRAELHERLANWVEKGGVGVVDRDEIAGYHVEQACRYQSELGLRGGGAETLARRGAEHLAAAGRRAFSRGDMGAAANLLRRAADLLLPESKDRIGLLPELGEALMEVGQFDAAQAKLDEAVAGASALGDSTLEADAVLTRLLVTHHTMEDLEAWRSQVQQNAERLLPTLQADEDAAVRAKAWRMVGFLHGTVGHWRETADAVASAIEAARLAGDARQVSRLSASYLYALSEGPSPAAEGILRAEELMASGLLDRQAEAILLLVVAPLHAMSKDFDRARELASRAEELLEELGAAAISARTSFDWGRIELMAGNPRTAAARLQAGFRRLTDMNENYVRPNIAALLAKALFETGSVDEASAFATVAAEIASADDVDAQVMLRSVQARVLDARGHAAEAAATAQVVVDLMRDADWPVLKADALFDVSEVLEVTHAQRAALLEEARMLYERKGHLVGLSRVDAELSVLR